MYRLYKRPGSDNWQVAVTLEGRTVRKSSGTSVKTLAKEFAHKLYTDLYHELKAGGKKQKKWKDAVIEYLHEDSSWRNNNSNRSLLRIISPYFDYGEKKLKDIDSIFINEQLNALTRDRSGKNGKSRISDSTRNRYAQIIKAVLYCAKRQKWIDSVPEFKILPENNERYRWLRWGELLSFLIALPDYLAYPTCFAVFSGLREKNITHLKWDQIDFQQQLVIVHSSQTKSGKTISFYLPPAALQILKFIKTDLQLRVGTDYPPSKDEHVYVFCWRRRQLKHINTKIFRRIRAEVGLDDVWEHDLRRTWASWHLNSGTSIDELTKIGGWSSIKVVEDRYAHLAPKKTQEKSQNLSPPPEDND